MGDDLDVEVMAKPDDPSTAPLDAWYMDDLLDDQRLPHRLDPNKRCPAEKLYELGVVYWNLDADKYETDPKLAAIRLVHKYNWMEIVTISEATLPNYNEKIKMFYEEHIHTDDEIRYILEGSGYFDVRDLEDKWIRIHCKKGDLIVLPEGIYHRFTLDTGNFAKAMRLFIGEPVWTPYNRPQDKNESRLKYLAKYDKVGLQTAAA